jgi:hypothetical protein
MADVKRNSTTTKSDIIDTHCTLRGIIANIDRHLDAAADAYIEKTVGSRLKLLPNNLIDKKFDEPPYNNGNPLDNEDGNPLDKDNGNPYNNGYDNESYDNIADPEERLLAVIDIVKWVSEKSLVQVQSLCTSMSDVLNYNFAFYQKHFHNRESERLEAKCIANLKPRYDTNQNPNS